MNSKYTGRIMIRVTVNGCGLPLDGARIYINEKEYSIPWDKDGFSDIISLFSSSEKGTVKKYTLKAEYEGFATLVCTDVPVTSGYLTVWNMPLFAKVKESQKILK